MKKKTHTGIRNSKLFCLNCGSEQIIPFPISVNIFSAMGKEFAKMHKNCPKTWKQPENELKKDIR